MRKAATNPHVSSIHAANFERALVKAGDLEEIKRLAAQHGPFLLGADKDRLRDQYKARAIALGGMHDEK